MIGIEPDKRLFYEGDAHYGHAVWPSPVVTIATIIGQREHTIIPDKDDLAAVELVFREDFFDPVTRVRRGRFYNTAQTQKEDWHVPRHPAFVEEVGYQKDGQGLLVKPLYTFHKYRFSIPASGSRKPIIVALGTQDASTFWHVIGVERVSTAEDLVTLKARSNMGVLPELADNLTDKDGNAVDAKPVQAALNALVDTFHRQQAVPVVDVGRETTKVILTAWIGPQAQTEDLGEIVRLIPQEKKFVEWAASLLNRFHPRGKNAERERQERRGNVLRPITDEDAETAAHLVGLVLREIGWAKPF